MKIETFYSKTCLLLIRLQVIQQLTNNDELSDKLLRVPLKSFVEILSDMAERASGTLPPLTVELVSLPPPDKSYMELAFAIFATNYFAAYTQYFSAGSGLECTEVLLSERLDFVLQSDPFATAQLVAASGAAVEGAAPPPPAPAPAAASDAAGKAGGVFDTLRAKLADLKAPNSLAVALESYKPSDVLAVIARRNAPLLDPQQEHGLMLYCFGSAPPNDIDSRKHIAALNNKFRSVWSAIKRASNRAFTKILR